MRGGVTLLAIIAAGWSVLLLAAPVVVVTAGPDEPATWGAAALYHVASRFCHQQVDRSFLWAGMPFPVCGRCLALYVAGATGVACAAIVAWTRPGWLTWPTRPLWRTSVCRPEVTWMAAAVAPSAVLFVGEWTMGNPGTTMRAIGSLPLGLMTGWLVGRALARGEHSPADPSDESGTLLSV